MSDRLFQHGGLQVVRASRGQGKGTRLEITTDRYGSIIVMPAAAQELAAVLMAWARDELERTHAPAPDDDGTERYR